MSPIEILEEVHRGAFGTQILTDGSYVVQEEGWFQVVSPKRPVASRNEIIHSQLKEVDAEKRISETIEFYKNLGTSFKWVVGPKTKPNNFGHLLKKQGLRSWQGRGMYCVPSEINMEVPKNLSVAEVDKSNLNIFVKLFMAGWELDRSLEGLFLQDFKWALEQPGRKFRYFIASINGKAAGVAGLFLQKDSGYLMGTMVLEAMRGKGVYKALVMRRLKDLKKLNISLAASGTREKTSAPILEKLGFQTAYRDEIFQYDFIKQVRTEQL